MGPYINSELMEAMCDGKLDAVNYSQPKKAKRGYKRSYKCYRKWKNKQTKNIIANSLEEIDEKYKLLKKCYDEVRNSDEAFVNNVDEAYENSTIYIVKNELTKKCYIGSTVNFEARKAGHMISMETDKRNPLYTDITKSTEPKDYAKIFNMTILENLYCNNAFELHLREDYWIHVYDTMNVGYNRVYNCSEATYLYNTIKLNDDNIQSVTTKLKKLFNLRLKIAYILTFRYEKNIYMEQNVIIKIKCKNTNNEIIQYSEGAIGAKIVHLYGLIKIRVQGGKLTESHSISDKTKYCLDVIEHPVDTFDIEILKRCDYKLSTLEEKEQIKFYTNKA